MSPKLKITVRILSFAVICGLLWFAYQVNRRSKPIKVGIIHSLTGPLGPSEKGMVDVTLMAIEEINAKGGLLDGRQIEAIVADCESSQEKFAQEAERLITEEGVSTIFGCWTSDSRKTALPVIEKYNHLLYYPVFYEGAERSKNVVYAGSTPNQRILPAIKWAYLQGYRNFYLVGSDYIYPYTANEIVKSQLRKYGARILGEDYFLLGKVEPEKLQASVERIANSGTGMIINNLVGPNYPAFIKALREAGIKSDSIPMLSFGLSEDQIRIFEEADLIQRSDWIGDYAAANYFQNLNTKENQEFVKRFKVRYGDQRVTDDFIESHYTAVYLWATAVTNAGSDDVGAIREHSTNISYPGPSGMVYIDPDNQHIWKKVFIGQVNEKLTIDVIYSSDIPIRPFPYPELYKTDFDEPEDWENYFNGLYNKWGGNWANPGLSN